MRISRLVGATVLAAALSTAAPAIAGAATFTVTTTADPSTGSCVPGNCSLRQAVIASNSNPGADTILVPAGVYTLKQPGQDLAISDQVTIKGTGGQAIVDANGPFTGDRAFEILAGANATFKDLSVRNGVGPKDNDGADRGGNIRVDQNATLTMSDGSVKGGNVPDTGSTGGGIYTDGALTLNRVQIIDNQTGFAFGGGLYADSYGYAHVNDSLIADNTSSFGGGFSGRGGATFYRSLLRDNSAGLGGAVYANGCGSFKFDYTTVANNNSSGDAGAIRVRDADLFLSNATVSGNQAAVDGGGIAVEADQNGCPTQIYTVNTILAGNTANGGSNADCLDQSGGDITDQGHNIVGVAGSCTFNGSGDQLGVDPKLKALAWNGGPTETMALPSTSAAIEKADLNRCGPTDQRGYAIAHDGDAGCDVGAYELLWPPLNSGNPPSISGKFALGHKLRCSPGQWAGARPMTFTYRWVRGGKTIGTHQKLKVTAADLHHKLTCVVTATNIVGHASNSVSANA